MTDVSVQYYDSGWEDLNTNLKSFKIEEYGVNRVAQANVLLFGKTSDLTDFLATPYRLIRIRANPSSWQDLFYGYTDNPFHKTLKGTLTDMRRVSLDCFGWEQRLATDFISVDYYARQSALTPLTDSNAWTYRKMIEDMIEFPDSTKDGTGLSGITMDLIAATDAAGIDHILESASSWNQHSLFEAIRIICDRIGYDGYYTINSGDLTPELHLFPFDKASSGYIYNPYIKEPEYEGGSLTDTANVIFIWGGIDVGVPTDKDRFTEYGASKYNPAAWDYTLSGTGDVTITDENNTSYFTKEELRVNDKCVKVTASNTTAYTLTAKLYLANTEFGTLDCENRLRKLIFNIRMFCSPSMPTNLRQLYIHLIDSYGQHIWLHHQAAMGTANFHNDDEKQVILNNLGSYQWICENPNYPVIVPNVWAYYTGSSTFHWDSISIIWIQTKWGEAPTTSHTWGFAIDGLHLVGGYKIEPFQSYSETLNPPAVGNTTYGIHPYHHTDNTITSFEQAQAEGARLVANLQNPIPRLTLTKILPTTQFKPSNVVTVSGVDYRVYGITHEWKTETKDVHATYKLVGKTAPLPPVWTEQNELRYLIK